VLIGHPASTVAHPDSVNLARMIRQHLPAVKLIFGGPHATYHASGVIENGDADYVVAHESEFVVTELLRRLEHDPLSAVDAPGVISRHRLSPLPAQSIANLDAMRPIWDGPWQLQNYRAYGLKSVVVQFSRGCPRRCSYCGQWEFWKSWRHRSVPSFVAEIDQLSQRGTRLFWIADENWAIHRDLFFELLHGLRRCNRGHHLIVAMEASHVERDIRDLRLYREAGVTQIMLGLDGGDDNLLGANPKDRKPVNLPIVIDRARAVGITTIINHFMPATGSGWPEDIDRLRGCRADFYNTLHPTPHAWTDYGRRASEKIVCRDLRKWDYRHPVIGRSAGELLLKRWRAKQVEFCLNSVSVLRVTRDLLLRRRPWPSLLFRSAVLTSMVFWREMLMLIFATLLFLVRYPCPGERSRRKNQLIKNVELAVLQS
jgi:anaerobic magnesium-protoporphyrin IX monomethyl ester cyclase